MAIKRGWFHIPGVQEGDRTLEQQMTGLASMLDYVKGKTVLDLGCAEGLISLEAYKAGASKVHAVDVNVDFIPVAQQQGGGVAFVQHNLRAGLPPGFDAQYDVVLALAIIHKMYDPEAFTRQVAGYSRDRVVIRLPRKSLGFVRGKHAQHMTCDIPAVMRQEGFDLLDTVPGPNDEQVQYWGRL